MNQALRIMGDGHLKEVSPRPKLKAIWVAEDIHTALKMHCSENKVHIGNTAETAIQIYLAKPFTPTDVEATKQI